MSTLIDLLIALILASLLGFAFAMWQDKTFLAVQCAAAVLLSIALAERLERRR